MSDKKRKQTSKAREEWKAADYYDLKTDAVNDLLNADESNSPKVSRAELRKYTAKRGGLHLEDWVKLLFIKWWFPAAVCFFILWGLGAMVPNVLDQLVITGLALGFVTDLLTNNVLRFLAKTEGANDRWMMHPRKGFWSLPLNILHAGVVLFLVYTAYNALNRALIALRGLPGDAVPLGVEPILFGLLCLGFDMMLIGIKHGFQKITADAKQKASAGRG